MSKKWGLIIDLDRCHDCNNCFLACKDEFVGNDWPDYSIAQPDHGHRWMNIHRKEQGTYPLVEVAYLPQPCQHCQDPPCLKAARDGAVTQREDGIVWIDPVKAKGQKQLVGSCPYGAIFWNEESEIPQKCTLCAHLLDDDWAEPRCVQVCPTGALRSAKLSRDHWESLVRTEDLAVYLPEAKARPRVFYKNLDRFTKGFIAGSVALADTDECAVGAEVTLLDQAGQKIASAETDVYGDFRLKRLDGDLAGLTVEFRLQGRETKRLEVDYKPGLNLGTIFI